MTEWIQGGAPQGAPVAGTFAGELYDELAPVAQHDEEHGWALARYVTALGAMFEDVEEIIRDRGGRPGWCVLFDPADCPDAALPWLAQFAGVPVVTTDPAVLRAAIAARAGFERGTPAALAAAVAGTLTGERAVRLLERENGYAYRIGVVTRTAETPDADATLAAAMGAKAAGLTLTLYVTDFNLYSTLFDDYATYALLLSTGPATYAGLVA